MVSVTLKNGQRAEVREGATIEPGVFPISEGANPAPALVVKNAAGATVASFRAADVSWYALTTDISIA